MDPNANLAEQRTLAARLLELPADNLGNYTQAEQSEAYFASLRLAELVEALDGWIKAGGFLPSAWKGHDHV
jgi:hypothetical protein